MLLAKYTWDIYLCHFTNLASHAVEERKAGGRPPRFLARAKKGPREKSQFLDGLSLMGLNGVKNALMMISCGPIGINWVLKIQT